MEFRGGLATSFFLLFCHKMFIMSLGECKCYFLTAIYKCVAARGTKKGGAMDFLRLWYVDEEFLNSLYNQISENITQMTISEGKSSDKDGEANIDIGEMFKRFKFPIGISLRTRYDIGNSVIKEKIVTPSIEYKIQKLQKHIKQKYRLNEIVKSDSNVRGIILVSGMFTLLELYYQGEKDKNLIHKQDFIEHPNELVWHMHWSMKVDNSRRDYENSEELVKDVSVEMFMDGEKLRRNIKHITTSIEKYHPFDFNIIGDFCKIDNCTYTLKPIIIYQDNGNL